jgi:hypothetical protein
MHDVSFKLKNSAEPAPPHLDHMKIHAIKHINSIYTPPHSHRQVAKKVPPGASEGDEAPLPLLLLFFTFVPTPTPQAAAATTATHSPPQ